jgi:hypothetical protein
MFSKMPSAQQLLIEADPELEDLKKQKELL